MRDVDEWGGKGINLLSAVACAGLVLVLQGPHLITLPQGIGQIKGNIFYVRLFARLLRLLRLFCEKGTKKGGIILKVNQQPKCEPPTVE